MLQRYLLALDEVNRLTAVSYNAVDGESLASRFAKIVSDILSLLIAAYRHGIRDISVMLGYDASVDVDKMYRAIYAVIDGKTFEARIYDHLAADDLKGLQSLAESEWHRVYNIAEDDGAEEYVTEFNAGVTKTWHTVGDDKVRDTHDYLDGTTIPLEQDFFTYDGDSAPAPGLFRRARNNVNCRCWLTYDAT